MAQEHGRNTLSAHAGPSTRHFWLPSGVLSARASTQGKLHCRIVLCAESLASPPSTSPRQSIASCTLLVFSNMGLTGFWSLMQSQAGRQWRECVFLDLEFTAAVLHDKLAGLGDPLGQWQRWQAFILGFPVVWKRLVKSFSAVARSPRQQVPSSVASWPYCECGMTLKTSKALASHQKERLSGPLCQRRQLPPFAVRSSILVGVPCTIVILAAKLARFFCCHLLVSLSSQRMKLPWRGSKTGSITRLPRLAVYGAMQVLRPVRPLETWTRPKTQRS